MHGVLLGDGCFFFGVGLAVVDEVHVLGPGEILPRVPVVRELIDPGHLVVSHESGGTGRQLGVRQVAQRNTRRERDLARVRGRDAEHGLGCGVGPSGGVLRRIPRVFHLVPIGIRAGSREGRV